MIDPFHLHGISNAFDEKHSLPVAADIFASLCRDTFGVNIWETASIQIELALPISSAGQRGGR